jgi:virginiamycin B lyase
MSGGLTEFDLPAGSSFAREIIPGPDGALWFTDSFANKIGRITTAGVLTEFTVPTADSFPAAIAVGPDGAIWFTEANPDANKIGRLTTVGVFREFPLPSPDRYPAGIAAGPDGNLWFTEKYTKAIGRITPSGVFAEFPIDAEFSQPVGITAGPDGNLWFTDDTGSIGRISMAGQIREFPLSHGGDDYENGITVGSDGALWFTWANAIGRITTGPCLPDASSLCLNAGRFRVQADWRVPAQASSGRGAAVSITADTGYFWFFSPGNVEVIVKVVDGCAFNGHLWVFAGGLTNVEVTLTVTDTSSGAVRTYVNPAGAAFLPIQDTAAFGDCS